MSGFEQVIELEGSQYNEVLILNKRGDNYQIILGRKPKTAEGTIMWQMCFPSFEKKPRDKAVPWCFTLGNMSQARKVAMDLCAALGLEVEIKNNKAQQAANVMGGKVVDDGSDIPF